MASLHVLPQQPSGHLRAYTTTTMIENISKRHLTLYPTSLLVAILVFLPFYIAYFLMSHKTHIPLKSGKNPKSKRPEVTTRLSDKPPMRLSAEGTESTEIRVSKESVFPTNWWSSDELFQLEKRAIFSKCWIYVTHSSRFGKPGDYLSFEITDLPFFIILGKDNQLRAFHNEKGSSAIIGCRYHGWSYNVRGALINAPQFEGVEGFDKDRNSLFEIHTRTTKEGFVFVNFDVSDNALTHPEEKLNAAVLHGGIQRKWVDGWASEGRFNWKITLRKFVFHISTVLGPPREKGRGLNTDRPMRTLHTLMTILMLRTPRIVQRFRIRWITFSLLLEYFFPPPYESAPAVARTQPPWFQCRGRIELVTPSLIPLQSLLPSTT
ncbi:ISP domain-containing protein [Tuber magnatum]|uniref:ISP domain-containing protein n=1 Tax=Tuber magnatum TaxID=42249 RepID=A0A317SYA5_9PEZI|nr:ISP domain-containing protein [Tuber magnatum]